MHENICLQCNKIPSAPTHRLVRDSCGHEKCRVCLLEDENDCKQCVNSINKQKPSIENSFMLNNNVICDRNGEIDSAVVVNNHTGVIQINGNVPSTSNLNGEVKLTPKPRTIEKNIEKTPGTNFNESVLNSLKVENKNILVTKIKKPDKQRSVKRSYSSIIIPKHVTVREDPLTYHCTICDKTFTTKTHVKYHIYCAGGKFLCY